MRGLGLEKRLTVERARELLSYDPETGALVWRTRTSNRVRVGGRAGSKMARWDYLEIGIDGVSYRAHRVAWLIHHGRWPAEFLDHVNGDGLDNRLANLREASPLENTWNMRRHNRNQVGLKGVSFYPGRTRPYYARIRAGGSVRKLGYFATAKEAHSAYQTAASKHFGEFARSE